MDADKNMWLNVSYQNNYKKILLEIQSHKNAYNSQR